MGSAFCAASLATSILAPVKAAREVNHNWAHTVVFDEEVPPTLKEVGDVMCPPRPKKLSLDPEIFDN